MDRIYYANQTGWATDEYYALWRFLNRLFLRNENNQDEIEHIDLGRCSKETQVLMYCIIVAQGKSDLLKLENLRELENVKPLETRLHIMRPPTNSLEIFERYNIEF